MKKFGQKVKFSKYLRKKHPATWVDIDNLSEGQKQELDKNDYIEVDVLQTAFCGDQEGLVVGKREMVQKRRFCTTTYGGLDELGVYPEYIEVYLVANNLRGFYRVPEDWLEEVKKDES